MKKKLILCVVTFLFPVAFSVAQSTDFGAILGVSYEKKLYKDFSLTIQEEVRFQNNFMCFGRLKSEIGVDYSFLKKRLNAEVNFQHLLYNQLTFLENRYRANIALTYAERVRQWKFSYKARFQFLFYDELRGEHMLNPKIYMRNRVEAEYSFSAKPLKIALSSEWFLRVNNPKMNIVDAVRTTLSFNYRLNKESSFTFFLRSNHEIQVRSPEYVYYVGCIYNFKH